MIVGCLPCEERKRRLTQLAEEGTPLPIRDYAFYLGWFLAGGALAYITWSRIRSERA
jgi:hypothetical protein